MAQNEHNHLDQAAEDRRKFLASCGRFAVVTPPAITLLLSTSLNSTAVAQSAGTNGNGDGTAAAIIAAIAATALAATVTTTTAATVNRPRKR